MTFSERARMITGLLIAGLSILSIIGISEARAVTSKVVPLVVYSAQGYDADVAKAFQAKTGIPVKLVDDSTGPLLTKVAAEKNNPQWDILWVDGATPFAALDKQGQLLSYIPKIALNAIGKAATPSDHSYVPVSITTMAALIYNSSKVTNVPATFNDLLDPKRKGQIGMNDPSQSGPTFPFVAGVMNQLGGKAKGLKAGEKYFIKLKANGLQVYPTNGDTLHALETGMINYGMIQSSAAIGEVIKFNKTSVAGFVPKIVLLPKQTLLPGVIGIDKHASSVAQAEAKRFVEYVLSAEGQKVMQDGDASGDSLYWPVVPGVKGLAGLPSVPVYQSIDPYFWGPQQSAIDTWFDSTIK